MERTIKIYRTNVKDTNNEKIMPEDYYLMFRAPFEIECEDLVNTVDDKNYYFLFQWYDKFNSSEHPLFSDKPITVGDVIVVGSSAFFVDNMGLKKVLFDENKTYKKSNIINAVYVEPGKPAFQTCVNTSLEGLQKAVNGYIEIVYDEKNNIIVCNEEAKLRGMKGNRHVGSDIIAGPFVIVGDDVENGSFVSLTDEQIAYYLQKYAVPEYISDQEVADAMRFGPM